MLYSKKLRIFKYFSAGLQNEENFRLSFERKHSKKMLETPKVPRSFEFIVRLKENVARQQGERQQHCTTVNTAVNNC